MRTKVRVILSTLAALLLLGAAIAAGLNAVFTVTYVRADFSTFSEDGNRDAAELKQKLDAFVGKSTTFLDLDEVAETVKEYPHFTVSSLKKGFPSTVEISILEREEVYAYAAADGSYTFLDGEGKHLTDGNASIKNRAGGENILLENFSLQISQTGEAEGEYFSELLSVMGSFAKTFSELRANIVSVSLGLGTADRENVIFRIGMKEGVTLVLVNPSSLPEEKAALAIARYAALSDEKRLYGLITVYETADGMIGSDYTSHDPFA